MNDYLMHYGVFGMHWGIRNSKKNINRIKNNLISDTSGILAGFYLSPLIITGSYFIAKKLGASKKTSIKVAAVSGAIGAAYISNYVRTKDKESGFVY